MAISTNSSVSTLNINDTEHEERLETKAGITITAPSRDSEDYGSISDIESVHSRQDIPAINSASKLSGLSEPAECTCICLMTGTPLGPPCRLCRTNQYNMIQEEQARRTRRHDRFRSMANAFSAKLSAFSRTCHWKKRKQIPRPEDRSFSCTKKTSLTSWSESEATYAHDEEPEHMSGQKEKESSFLEHKVSVSSSGPKLSLRGTFSKAFSRIPDTEDEKTARREEKRLRGIGSYGGGGASVDYWHDERGMIDWRVVWAMSAMC